MIRRAAHIVCRSARVVLAGRDGIAYVVVVAIAAIVAVTGAAYALLARTEAEIAQAQVASLQALYVAESGIDYAVRVLKKEKGTAEWAGVTNYSFGPGNFTVTVNRSPTRPNGYDFRSVEILSTGAIDGKYKRKVRRRFLIYPSMFTVALYSQTQFEDKGSGTEITGGTAVATYASFPKIRSERMKTDATTVIIGNTVWSTPGQVKNGCHFIDGSLTITGPNTVVNGCLLVDGQLAITSAAVGTQITVPPTEKSWPAAIIANSQIDISAANVKINGRVVVNGKVDILAGGLEIKGGVYAKGKITNDPNAGGGGSTKITYFPAVIEQADEYFYYGTTDTPSRTAKIQTGSWYLFP